VGGSRTVTFNGSFRPDLTKSATVTNGGLRIFHSVKRQAIPIGFDQRQLGPLVGKILGFLDGTHQTDEIKHGGGDLGARMENVCSRD